MVVRRHNNTIFFIWGWGEEPGGVGMVEGWVGNEEKGRCGSVICDSIWEKGPLTLGRKKLSALP